MSNAGSGDKTEKPTPKKLREARRNGQIARSPDIGAWVGVLAAASLLPVVVRHLVSLFEGLMAQVPALIERPDTNAALHLLRTGVTGAATTVAPLTLTLLGIGVAASAAQGGIKPAWSLAKPKFSRINPGAGIKRLLGPHGAWAAAKSLIKLTALAGIAYLSGKSGLRELLSPQPKPLSLVVTQAGATILHIIRWVAAAQLVVAVADYAVERRRIGKSLKMTKHEVKEESKQSEGDPHVKSAIKSRQFELSRNRMIADIATADVVVVNPTHVAVALRYEPGRGAPRVVAKGAGAIAARIREEAERQRVPMVQDVPLARAIYAACQLGAEVPAELYDAVARVLAFIFSLRRRGASVGTGVHRIPILPGAPAAR